MLVDDGAHALLVVVVAVEVGNAFLYEALGFSDFSVGGSEAPVLVLDGEIDIHVLVECPSMIVVAPDLGDFPFLDGFDELLRGSGEGENQGHKRQ